MAQPLLAQHHHGVAAGQDARHIHIMSQWVGMGVVVILLNARKVLVCSRSRSRYWQNAGCQYASQEHHRNAHQDPTLERAA